MRRLLAILVMAATAQGAVYYVDSSYGTGGNGSESTPWDQLADLPSLSAGDTVRLKRGSVFREGLAITADNVTVEAYGTGDDPVLKGSDLVTTWMGGTETVMDVSLTTDVYLTYPEANYRQVLDEDVLSASASSIRVTLRMPKAIV